MSVLAAQPSCLAEKAEQIEEVLNQTMRTVNSMLLKHQQQEEQAALKRERQEMQREDKNAEFLRMVVTSCPKAPPKTSSH
eukprot:10276109-Karenia_brevis.AAC.1